MSLLAGRMGSAAGGAAGIFSRSLLAPLPAPAASAKACFGHTEGTAGVHGALTAVLALQLRSAPPVMHLRHVNPHVASALDEWQGKLGLRQGVPRAAAAWAAGAASLAGCSSFGMSGTNAHALFSAAHAVTRAPPRLAWQRARHWPLPRCCHMLAGATAERQRGICRLQVPLASPQLAFLLDHVVQATPIMPGAGMLETATASCRALLPDASHRALCLTQAAIPAPVVLTAGAGALLECQVACATGELQLRSTSRAGPGAQLHFRATAGSLPPPPPPPPAPPAPSPPAPEAAPGQENAGAVRVAAPALGVRRRAARRRSVRCVASVTLSQQHSGPGWVGHPAAVDNALQLGPATGDVGREDTANVTRVVAGIAAYAVHEAPPPAGEAHTCTERAPMAADGTIYTTHWLLTPGGERSVHVMDLQAKVINLDAARGEAAAAEALDRQRLIYAVEWQAHAAEAARATRRAAAGCGGVAPPTYLLTSPGQAAAQFELTDSSADGAQRAASTASTLVGFVQGVMQGAGAGLSMQLASHGAQPASRTPTGADANSRSSTAALSIQALARVATSEYPAVQWGGIDVAQQAQRAPAGLLPQRYQQHSAEVGGATVYGHTLASGLWLAPRLLVRPPPPPAKHRAAHVALPELPPHLAGAMVVTGGMGALGALVATWLAGLGASNVWLLGRSGRTSGDPLPALLYRAAGAIVCAKGDVSSAEEAAHIVHAANGGGGDPLRGVMHAGAVLDSKVLSNVTARSIRTEYSGESNGWMLRCGIGVGVTGGTEAGLTARCAPCRQGVWRAAAAAALRAQRAQRAATLLLAGRLQRRRRAGHLRRSQRGARRLGACRPGRWPAGGCGAVGQLGGRRHGGAQQGLHRAHGKDGAGYTRPRRGALCHGQTAGGGGGWQQPADRLAARAVRGQHLPVGQHRARAARCACLPGGVCQA